MNKVVSFHVWHQHFGRRLDRTSFHEGSGLLKAFQSVMSAMVFDQKNLKWIVCDYGCQDDLVVIYRPVVVI